MRTLEHMGYEMMCNPVASNRFRMVEAARTCTKLIGTGPESDSRLLKQCFDRGEHSVFEHSTVEIKFFCDRGISHEIVRHRIASFNQESTRYCNYSKGRFGKQITTVKPVMIARGSKAFDIWFDACEYAEKAYFALLDEGMKPETARSVLPTCLKTEIDVSCNLREWYTILDQRTGKTAHPDMRILMYDVLFELSSDYPEIFHDLCVSRAHEIAYDFANK